MRGTTQIKCLNPSRQSIDFRPSIDSNSSSSSSTHSHLELFQVTTALPQKNFDLPDRLHSVLLVESDGDVTVLK